MDRRRFIKALGALTVTYAVPPNLVANFTSLTELAPEATQLTIDLATKTIKINPEHSGMTVLQFHRYLMDLWDEPEMMDQEIPSSRMTDQHFRMENGWSLTHDSMYHLRDGSLVQGDMDGDFTYYVCQSI